MEKYEWLFKLIDDQAKISVGILCKRIEVLEKHDALTPKLYKDLVKEIIYEQSRALKKLIEIGHLEFKQKPKEQSNTV